MSNQANFSDVVIERTEPDPASREFPCPHQIVQYKCQTLIPAVALTWRLPSGDTLPDYTGISSVGTVRNSSDDQFSATLTGKMEDDDTMTDFFFYTSTLLILSTTNDSILTCLVTTIGQSVQHNTSLFLSGESH